jgi:uncharacterized membrane protein
MPALIASLVVFFATHSVRLVAAPWRDRQIARMGIGPWKLAYSAVALAALALVIWAFGIARAEDVVLWRVPAAWRHVTVLLTVVGFILIAAGYVPGTHFKAVLGHPMTAGVALWATGHLIANGRLTGALLFGAFLAWSVIAFAIRRRRDRLAGVTYAAGSIRGDAIAVAAGIVVSLVFALYLHGPLIGVRPFG